MKFLNLIACQRSLAAIGAALLATTALAGPSHSSEVAFAQAQARFRQNMASCDSLKADKARETCRAEARNALDEAKNRRQDSMPCEAVQANDPRACSTRPLQ